MTNKKLTVETLNLFFKYAKEEFWEIEEIYIRALLKSNPNDFFIFYEKEKLIGFVIALKENNTFGFISSVLVLKNFRGLGYGKKIFIFAIEHLKCSQIAVDSTKNKESFYEKFGFKSYFNVCLYRFTPNTLEIKSDRYKVIEFDKKLSLYGQSTYIKQILLNENILYKAIKHGDNINSFAFSYPYKDGYKITINADHIDKALTLFVSILNQYEKKRNIYIQVTRLSPVLEDLVQHLKMRVVSKHIRMYNKIL